MMDLHITKSYDILEDEATYYSELAKEEIKVKVNNEEKYIRQHGWFTPEKQRLNPWIFGVGSTGSLLALNLAKLGFNNITCLDFDSVSLHNIPNQFYRISDIGKLKTESLKEIIKDFSDTDINIINEKITASNIASVTSGIDLNSIIILCFDNIESRKLIFNQFKGMPIYLIDTRMGGLGYELYTIKLDNYEDCSRYEKSLDMPTMDLQCGQQAVIYVLSSLAGETARIITLINNNESYPKILKRNMGSYIILKKFSEKTDKTITKK